jgi:hypothetical protein
MGAVAWARRQRSVSHPRSSRRGLFCVERQASYVRIRGAASVLRDLVFRYQLSYSSFLSRIPGLSGMRFNLC